MKLTKSAVETLPLQNPWYKPFQWQTERLLQIQKDQYWNIGKKYIREMCYNIYKENKLKSYETPKDCCKIIAVVGVIFGV